MQWPNEARYTDDEMQWLNEARYTDVETQLLDDSTLELRLTPLPPNVYNDPTISYEFKGRMSRDWNTADSVDLDRLLGKIV